MLRGKVKLKFEVGALSWAAPREKCWRPLGHAGFIGDGRVCGEDELIWMLPLFWRCGVGYHGTDIADFDTSLRRAVHIAGFCHWQETKSRFMQWH